MRIELADAREKDIINLSTKVVQSQQKEHVAGKANLPVQRRGYITYLVCGGARGAWKDELH